MYNELFLLAAQKSADQAGVKVPEIEKYFNQTGNCNHAMTPQCWHEELNNEVVISTESKEIEDESR